VSFGAVLGLLAAGCFALLYFVLSSFAHALESLSDVRRKALVEEEPGRFGRLLSGANEGPARIAARMTAQGAVLGGLLATTSVLSAFDAPSPWLLAAAAILVGWLLLEAAVLRSVSKRGPEALLVGSSWLIPIVAFFSAPLTPFLARLTARPPGPPPVDESTPEEKEATKDAEVRALLDVAREEGILEKHDAELVSRAVDFGDRTVRDVMTPRADMTVLEATAPLDQVADLFVSTKFTRIPIVDGGLDHPVGIVHVKDVFTVLRSGSPPATAQPLARPVLFAPEMQTIRTLLADFRRRRQQMAIVVDEYGAVAGLATLEDLVEELVGEIADEHEVGLDPVVPLGDGAYTVAGRVRISELEALFDVAVPPAPYDTVAGLVSAALGRIPKPGEAVEEAGLLFTVEEADRRRIHRVKVAPVARRAEAAGGEE
jgi:CBS domain containing-hemolysin-like protein